MLAWLLGTTTKTSVLHIALCKCCEGALLRIDTTTYTAVEEQSYLLPIETLPH